MNRSIDPRVNPRDPSQDGVFRALRLIQAYANPLRGQMPLSSTEVLAVKQASKELLRTVVEKFCLHCSNAEETCTCPYGPVMSP